MLHHSILEGIRGLKSKIPDFLTQWIGFFIEPLFLYMKSGNNNIMIIIMKITWADTSEHLVHRWSLMNANSLSHFK